MASSPASMIRPTSPLGERTGMPTFTPSAAPADRIAKRRGLLKEEPTIRPVAMVVALRWRSCSVALSCLFSWKIALASTIRWSIAVRSRLSWPFWWAASQ